MEKNRSNVLKINMLCGIVLVLVASEATAVDGKLVVNGFEIPDRWFANYSRHHNLSNDTCKPEIDDTFLIEQAVSLMLPVQEAESRGLTLSPERKEYIEGWLEKPNDFSDDTDPDFNAKGEAIYLGFRRVAYSDLLTKELGDDEIMAEYNEQIKDKNPALVNRQIVKVQEFDFSSRADAEKVQSIYQAGGDYLGATKSLLDESDYNYSLKRAEEWKPLEFPKNKPDGSPELKVGDNFVTQTQFWWKFHAVVASEIISEVGIDDKIPGALSSVKRNLYYDLLARVRDDLLDELRGKATVTLDGAPVPKPENYRNLLNRGSYRTNLITYPCSNL